MTMHIKTPLPAARFYASYERQPVPTSEESSTTKALQTVEGKLYGNPDMTKREAVNAVLRDVVNSRDFEIEDGLWLLSNLYQHWAIESRAKRDREIQAKRARKSKSA